MENKEDESIFVPLECVDSIFKGKYEIDNLGHIKIIGKNRILKVFTKGTDYPFVILCPPNNSSEKRKKYFIHVLLAKTFIFNDDPETKIQVNHKNLDRFDYSLSNLEWVSPSDNLRSRGDFKSWNRQVYYKVDDNGDIIEEISRDSLTGKQRKSIASAISKNERCMGFHWRKIDTEVEDYYSQFNDQERSKEEWREAIGHSGIYVSNLGLVKTRRGITIGHLNDHGYRTVNLKPHVRVHTLVAETFILGRKIIRPEIVDHINCVRDFNAVWNLKVCENQRENLLNPLSKSKGNHKKVGKFNLSGELVKEYDSISEALSEFGFSINNSKISCCCKEHQIAAYGFLWAYLDGTEREVINRKLVKINNK